MKPVHVLLLLAALAGLGVGTLLLLQGSGAQPGSVPTPSSPAAIRPEGADDAPITPVAHEPDAGDTATARAAAPIAEATPGATANKAPADDGADGPFLRGRVVDESGIPVRDAEVEISAQVAAQGLLQLTGEFSGTATTDANGNFAVPRRKIGSELEIEVKARGFRVLDGKRTADNDKGDGRLGSITLERATVLAGKVVDARGLAVAGATVRRTTPEDENNLNSMLLIANAFDGANPSRVETDDEGQFVLAHEEVGEYVLLVRHDDHPEGRFEGRTAPLGQEEVGLVLQLAPTASISGRVRDFPNGREHITAQASPHANEDEDVDPMSVLLEMTNMADSHKAEIAADGTFEITGLDVGQQYTVQAFGSDGFMRRTACSDSKTVPAGTSGLELTWDAGASIVFRVRDAATSNALEDITVRYLWTDESDGWPESPKKREFTATNIVLDELRPNPNPGTLTLSVSAPGYREHRATGVSVAEDAQVDLGVIELVKSPILRVRVVDADGDPVKRARVLLQPNELEGDEAGEGLATAESSEKTGSDGWCELPAVATPTATLIVSKLGFANYRGEDLLMPTQGKREELVQLSEGGKVEVVVRDSAGEPVAEAIVYHTKPDSSDTRKTTNSKGEVAFKDLEAGNHRFRAERSSGQGAFVVRSGDEDEEEQERWETTTVSSGSSASLVLRVPVGAEVLGTVSASGSPVANARVMLLPGWEGSNEEEARLRIAERMERFGPNAPSQARTDRLGKFVLSDATPGKHRVRVVQASGAPPHEVQIEVREGENRVDVELPGGAIEGRVVDADGVPIENATVSVHIVREGDGDEKRAQELAAVSEMFGGGKGSGVRTDAHGVFTVEGLSNDVEVVIEARARGFVTRRSDKVAVKDNGVRRGVEIALSAAGSIRVLLQDESDPFEMVSARYVGEADPTPAPKMALAAKGKAVLRDLAPGTWRVKRNGEDDESGQLVEVREGEETSVTL